MRQLTLDVRLAVVPTLENFVADQNADLLVALRQQLTLTDGSWLYLWGESGSGRTHLLQAAVAHCQNPPAGRPRPARYVRAVELAAVPLEPGVLLAIDDVDQLDAEGQAALFRLMICAREAGGSLVLAGGRSPQQLAIREDVRTRIGQTLVFEIKPLSDAAKSALFCSHAAARGMVLEQDIVDYLLRHGRRDLPWLMTVLDALDEISLTHGRRVTLPLLRELILDPASPPPARTPSSPAK